MVALAVAAEQWRVLGADASWVGVAAVFTLTLGQADSPRSFVVPYAGLVLLGGAVGVLVTTLLFPPLQLTQARDRVRDVRTRLADHLERSAGELRAGPLPTLEERHRAEVLALRISHADACRIVERARRANPRARKWREPAAQLRAQISALDRVAVLADDVTTLLDEYQPQQRGGDRPELGTAERLADALDGLAGVVRTPFHDTAGARPDDRDRRIERVDKVLDNLTDRLRADHRGRRPGLPGPGRPSPWACSARSRLWTPSARRPRRPDAARAPSDADDQLTVHHPEPAVVGVPPGAPGVGELLELRAVGDP